MRFKELLFLCNICPLLYFLIPSLAIDEFFFTELSSYFRLVASFELRMNDPFEFLLAIASFLPDIIIGCFDKFEISYEHSRFISFMKPKLISDYSFLFFIMI